MIFHKIKEEDELNELDKAFLENTISKELDELKQLKIASDSGLNKQFNTLFLEQYVLALGEFKINHCNGRLDADIAIQIEDEVYEVKSKYDTFMGRTDQVKILITKTSFKQQNILFIKRSVYNLHFYSSKLLGIIDNNTFVFDRPQDYLLITAGNGKENTVHFNESNNYINFSQQNEFKVLSEVSSFIKNKNVLIKNEHRMPDFLKNCFIL